MSEDRLFGELLGRLVPLSNHDVCEILEEQSGSRRRFGQIALSWGLCEAQHVWQVWAAQLNGRTPRVDLLATGIDTQATLRLPAALAARLRVVPVRSVKGRLIVAATESGLARAAEVLANAGVAQQVCFVVSDARQIEQAIESYYGQWLTAGCAEPCAVNCKRTACKRASERSNTAPLKEARSPRPCAASSPAAEPAAAAFAPAAPPRPLPLRAPEQCAV